MKVSNNGKGARTLGDPSRTCIKPGDVFDSTNPGRKFFNARVFEDCVRELIAMGVPLEILPDPKPEPKPETVAESEVELEIIVGEEPQASEVELEIIVGEEPKASEPAPAPKKKGRPKASK